MNKYAHLAPPQPSVAGRRCLTKKRYMFEAVAKRMATDIAKRGGPALHTYRCPMCLRWHLTSKPVEATA